jgi:hypothetical protein
MGEGVGDAGAVFGSKMIGGLSWAGMNCAWAGGIDVDGAVTINGTTTASVMSVATATRRSRIAKIQFLPMPQS